MCIVLYYVNTHMSSSFLGGVHTCYVCDAISFESFYSQHLTVFILLPTFLCLGLLVITSFIPVLFFFLISLSLSLSLSHTRTHTHTHTQSLPYYSPCGKKFRSKPQIARFLGETADLGCFDFSRAGTPGDGSQRRRARDRSAKKSIEPVGNKQVPTVRPLTNNPLRPSGPIRRTCGVIKLPVIWVAPPTDDDVKNDVMSAPLSLPAHPVSQAKPAEASTTAQQQQQQQQPSQQQGQQQQQSSQQPQVAALVAPAGNGAAELVVPAMWENRLVGVKPCDHETGMEIVVAVNKPQNGLSVCGTGASLPDGVNGGELNSNVLQNSPTLQSLIRQQQQAQQQQQKKTGTNVMATLNPTQSNLLPQGIKNTTAPASLQQLQQQPNLIQSLKSQQQQKHLPSTTTTTGALLTTQAAAGMVLTGASLSNLLRQQQQLQQQRQKQQQQHGSIVGMATVTSGRTTAATTAVGSNKSSIGMAATGNSRLTIQEGGGGHQIRQTSTKQGLLTNKELIKLSLTAGAASSSLTSTFGSSASISNGPSSMDIDTDQEVGVSSSSKFVSESDIKLQEEKVRQLRQQLLAAAQAAAKGSTFV